MDVKKGLLFFLLLLIIGCTPDPPSSSGFQKSTIPNCDQQIINGEYIVSWKDGRVTLENAKSDKNFIEKFLEKNREQIKYAEPHYRVSISNGMELKPFAEAPPINWGNEAVNAQQAWEQNYTGEGVVVAIIDSGFDDTHEELQDVLAINENEIPDNDIDDDENGLVDDYAGYDFAADSHKILDYTGHGTHIAGIIGGKHDEGVIEGVAPGAKLLPLTFIEQDGAGSVRAALAAIRYTIERGVKVINASWGGEGCSLALRDEIKALAEHDILFVSAAGNSGSNLDDFPEYPAAFTIDNQIAVGASTFDNKTAGFSNYGSFVSLVAPGAQIISTYPLMHDTPTFSDQVDDGLRSLNGTSMAAPYVAAAAAILWSKNPQATYSEVKKALLDGVQQGPYPVTTRGQLDIERSLELLPEPTPEDPPLE